MDRHEIWYLLKFFRATYSPILFKVCFSVKVSSYLPRLYLAPLESHLSSGVDPFTSCTGTGLWIGTKVAFQTLHCYCVCCELLSASIADALLFVNIIVSGIFHGRFAQRLAVNKPCLQIVRHLLWKQTTTHSIRNNNAMFEQQPLSQFKGPSQ